MREVAVVIVTYESAGVIGAAVDSCLRELAEVIVVDNASSDGTVEEVRKRPGVRVIANQENRGFAAAVNQGVSFTDGQYILLLNPDAVLEQGLEYLVESCAKEGTGAATGKLLNENGVLQEGFAIRRLPTAWTLILEVTGINRLWPSNGVNRRYRCLDFEDDKPGKVEQPAGAYLMLKRSAWVAAGGFDERFYPIWFEDVDYCKRLTYNGFEICYEPRASARHLGGHSARQMGWESKEVCWYASLLRYAGKHFSRPALASVSLAVMAGSLLRLVTGIHSRGVLKPVRIYGKVIRLACRYLSFGDNGAAER